MNPVGYVSDQAILCDNCADDGDSPIWSTTEVDAPWHCAECGAVIPCTLTAEGERYVRERIQQYLTNRTGDPTVLENWCEELLGVQLDLGAMHYAWNFPQDRDRLKQAHDYLYLLDRMSDEPVAVLVAQREEEVNERLPNGLRLVEGKLEVFL